MAKKWKMVVLGIAAAMGLLAIVGFKPPQGDAFVDAAKTFSKAAEKYQATDVGARQYELRYLVRDLYVNCPERELYHEQIFALGADLQRRVEMKWAPKIAIGKLKVDPARVATPQQLLEASAVYAQHWESEGHVAAWKAAKNIDIIRLIQAEARKVFEEGGTFSDLWGHLESKGFSLDNPGDKRVHGRLENLFSQWEAGNGEYMIVPLAK